MGEPGDWRRGRCRISRRDGIYASAWHVFVYLRLCALPSGSGLFSVVLPDDEPELGRETKVAGMAVAGIGDLLPDFYSHVYFAYPFFPNFGVLGVLGYRGLSERQPESVFPAGVDRGLVGGFRPFVMGRDRHDA